MKYRRTLAPVLIAVALAAAGIVWFGGFMRSEAVQNPSISLDMITAGNTYDEVNNHMAIGAIDNCLSSPTANPNTHVHTAHFVIQNVEDLVGWQARMNYTGDRFRPNTVSFTPFVDNNTAQGVSFVNLPIDQTAAVHRDITPAQSIPPSAPGPQTALVGSVYLGTQNFAVSPDTPAKAVPDDTSYSTSGGGVLAAVNLSVVGNQSGQSLLIDLDDDNPNPPGSAVVVFTGTGTTQLFLAEGALGDGTHGEGVACGGPPVTCFGSAVTVVGTDGGEQISGTAGDDVIHGLGGNDTIFGFGGNDKICGGDGDDNLDGGGGVDQLDGGPGFDTCVDDQPTTMVSCEGIGEPTPSPTPSPTGVPTVSPSPSPTASPTATPVPVAGHDARLTRISGVPKNVRLSAGEVINDTASVVVANESNHTETIGVYVDVAAPAACNPNSRVLQTTVTLAAGAKTTLPVAVAYSCMDVVAADGQFYSWTAVADHGGDDLGGCAPGTLQGLACFNALANDDADNSDNRVSRTGPRVVAQ